MNISAALANIIGASALIILTSSSTSEAKFCTSRVIRGQKFSNKPMASLEAPDAYSILTIMAMQFYVNVHNLQAFYYCNNLKHIQFN
ncbi:hypothetical protein BpHYR1_021862 [Brachionus plicatilis]|uniref:Secreted protein n=1 Tax=Brachionus plicatilis TaxID=10195 RepID=A0A3M7T435_BRAPC|nr:hypothetical protein BpHYR1_021862 [Brachionus plicatilis]